LRKPLQASRLTLEATQELSATPEEVFPLLCPVREGEWLEGWKCEVIHTGTGLAEQDCVFVTRGPDGGEPDVWLISRHLAPREVEFIRFDRRRVMRYTISLEKRDDGNTTARWRQVITATDGGDLESISQEQFSAMVAVDEKALNHFLKTGECLSWRA
jgi:hypothetical protein